MAEIIARSNHRRNTEIMRLYFRGLSFARIAVLMGVSRNAVAGVVHRSTFSNRGGQRRPFEDLTGQSFGRWLVLSRAENTIRGETQFKCRCSCGTIRVVRPHHLKAGTTRSCGCLFVELCQSRRKDEAAA